MAGWDWTWFELSEKSEGDGEGAMWDDVPLVVG
jgi:hypothetical protein